MHTRLNTKYINKCANCVTCLSDLEQITKTKGVIMKTSLVIAFVLVVGGFAKAEQKSLIQQNDKCLAVLTAHYEDLGAKASNFGFEGLSKLTRQQAITMTEEALIESRDEEINQIKMRRFVKNKSIAFYEFFWSAPSNTGSTIVAAKKSNCEIVGELFYWSEE